MTKNDSTIILNISGLSSFVAYIVASPFPIRKKRKQNQKKKSCLRIRNQISNCYRSWHCYHMHNYNKAVNGATKYLTTKKSLKKIIHHMLRLDVFHNSSFSNGCVKIYC